jgi:uncharacterized protein YjbJ (UPF0337 family)
VSKTDKMKNQAQQAMGKAKEWVGDKTNNEQMEAEGQRDQASGKMKGADQDMQQSNQDMIGR